MNKIEKRPVALLGYDFISGEFLPDGEDEYYLRNLQNKNGITYRRLTAYEIEALVRNRNTSDNWDHILVSDLFSPELVKSCQFYGLVRIGKLESYYLEFKNLRLPVGLYNSTIISCDFGDNVVIDNVNYIAHYIVGNEVMIVNVNELATTNAAKFGNGILKEGEPERSRIRLEICNENGGRSVIPFENMLPGDAFLWSRFRNDSVLQSKFEAFTDQAFDKRRGYYGEIGDRTVIKNCKIIKDVWIGSDAYLKGANKLKNLTINSSPGSKSQIGEGCEIVNGIIGYGCRVFYGVKAVRFIMASHSQLKYGARLINSYLGNNATISCCEVLNTLIFPAHEQHHNNSFLCASLVLGQSNIAAGATIGSNHNSRSADGEMLAGRGFWPGLCVSLKHNSRFASFTILSKGDYPAEIDLPIPFSLVSNNVHDDTLGVMPGYWFMYNMYALSRNAWKYVDRDQRKEKLQLIEYGYLAPDSVNEMLTTLPLLELCTGKAFYRLTGKEDDFDLEELKEAGRKLLTEENALVQDLEILAEGIENSGRQVILYKVPAAYQLFKDFICYYLSDQLISFYDVNGIKLLKERVTSGFSKALPESWVNVGGQLIRQHAIDKLVEDIHAGRVSNWEGIHEFYQVESANYPNDKLTHAFASVNALHEFSVHVRPEEAVKGLLHIAIKTRHWIQNHISESRAKDYANPFRKMLYNSEEEMNAVLGSFEDNSFIEAEAKSHDRFIRLAEQLLSELKD
jgi:hypothetical protein